MVHENIVIESERKEGYAKYKLVNGVFLVETLSRSSVAGLEKIRLQVSWLNTERLFFDVFESLDGNMRTMNSDLN